MKKTTLPHYLLILTVILLIPLSITAQSWQWAKRGGTTDDTSVSTNNYEQVISMVTDSQDNVYILTPVGIANLNIDGHPKATYGIYDGGGGAGLDYVITSFGCDGSYRWSQVIGGQFEESMQMLQIDADDNIYAAGQAYNHTDDFNFPGSYAKVHMADNVTWPYAVQGVGGYASLFIVKYDSNGNLIWYRRPQPDNADQITGYSGISVDLQTDPQGNSFWTCYLRIGSYANGAYNVTQDGYYILKYDANGNFTDSHPVDIVVNGPLYNLGIRMRRNHHNGHWYLSGFVYKLDNNIEVTIGGQVVQYGKFIAAFDADDNFLWMRENNSTRSSNRVNYDMAFDELDNIYLTGSGGTIGSPLDPDPVMESFNGNQVTAPSDILQTPCPYLIKLDPQGNTVWFTSGFDKYSEVAGITVNGNEVAYCSQQRGIQWGSVNIPYNNKGHDPYVARFNRDTGATIAIDTFSSTNTTNDCATAITHDTQGNYLVGGRFWSGVIVGSTTLLNPGGETDFFVAKLGTQCDLGTEDPTLAALVAYPNPVRDVLHLDNTETLDYVLYTITGAKVQYGMAGVAAAIDVEALGRGLYLLELRNAQGERRVLKIVKE